MLLNCGLLATVSLFLQNIEVNYCSSDADELILDSSRGAALPSWVFGSSGEVSPAAIDNLVHYVPVSSRSTSGRAVHKSWTRSTFDTYLLKMPLQTFRHVKFLLHTKTSPENGEELSPWNPETIRRSSWNPNENLKILIHGYRQNQKTMNMPVQLLEAYKVMNYSSNLVVVDWGMLAAQPYFESAMYAQQVGKTLAEFLLVVKNRGFLKSYATVHIVGACLGAHVAGVAAHRLKQRAGNFAILGRITGLDPSGPGFYSAPSEMRLDSRDADFVDTIHTNGGLNFRSGELGIPMATGGADFYPNGGLRQPICADQVLEKNMIRACDHLKAADYFKRSIAEEVFKSCRCESWSAFDTEFCSCENGPLMGEYLPKTIGKFYLHVFEYTLFEMFENEGLMRR